MLQLVQILDAQEFCPPEFLAHTHPQTHGGWEEQLGVHVNITNQKKSIG